MILSLFHYNSGNMASMCAFKPIKSVGLTLDVCKPLDYTHETILTIETLGERKVGKDDTDDLPIMRRGFGHSINSIFFDILLCLFVWSRLVPSLLSPLPNLPLSFFFAEAI